VWASISSPSHAYIDPATGSIVIQAMVGAVATWIMYSKLWASKAKKFFFRGGKRRRPDGIE
jgi:hypothetical protein